MREHHGRCRRGVLRRERRDVLELSEAGRTGHARWNSRPYGGRRRGRERCDGRERAGGRARRRLGGAGACGREHGGEDTPPTPSANGMSAHVVVIRSATIDLPSALAMPSPRARRAPLAILSIAVASACVSGSLQVASSPTPDVAAFVAPGPGHARLEAAVVANRACETCHADVAAEWSGSLHHRAGIEPAYLRSFAVEPLPFCRSCHVLKGQPPRTRRPRSASSAWAASPVT